MVRNSHTKIPPNRVVFLRGGAFSVKFGFGELYGEIYLTARSEIQPIIEKSAIYHFCQ